MADKFTIEVINGAIAQILTQVGQADKAISNTLRNYKTLLSQQESLNKQYKDKDVNSTKQSEDKKTSIRKASLNKTLAAEKERYSKSEQLALQLQNTLRSVFERAIFYTAVYRGISMVTGAFKDWIAVNIKLDYALAKVNTISNVTISQMGRLTDLSLDTGRGLVDVSNALYEINSAGITGARAMTVLEVATRAAVAGFVDAKNAADVITDVLNAYHLSASDAEEVTDKLLKTVELGKLKWEDYQGVLGRVLPQAYNLGISLEELLGSLGTLTLSGLKFREAAVGMRNIMIKLQKPTKGMDKALIQLNYNLGETFGSIQDVIKAKGLIPTIQLLGEVLDQTDLDTVDLFNNVRGLTAQLSLMSDAGQRATEVTAKIGNSAGTLNEKMAIMSKTIEEAQNRLKTAWEALGFDLFNFNDGLTGLIDTVRGFVLSLRSVAPLLIGVSVAFATLTAGAALLGVKFIVLKTLLPLVARLFATTAPVATGLSIAIERIGVSATTASVGVWTLNSALGVITVVVATYLGVSAMMNSWLSRNADEAKRLAESTNEMNDAFKKAAAVADLLSKVRPFKGMTNKQITDQIAQNNVLLKDRIKILAKIVELEEAIRNINIIDRQTGVVEKLNEQLNEQKNALFIIEGYQGRNLDAMQALNKEHENRIRKLKDETVLVNDLAAGYDISSADIAAEKYPELKKITEELGKQLEYEKAIRKLSGITATGDTGESTRYRKLLHLFDLFSAEIKLKEEVLRSGEVASDVKNNEKRLEFLKKFYDAILKETLQGRIDIIRLERDEAIKEANDNAKLMKNAERDNAIAAINAKRKEAIEKANASKKATKLEIGEINKLYDEQIEVQKDKVTASEKDLAAIRRYYDNQETEERTKHDDKILADEKKKAEEILADEKKKAEEIAKLNKIIYEVTQKQYEETEKLIDKYLKSELDRIKEKYDEEIAAAAGNKDLETAIIKAKTEAIEKLEKDSAEKITQIKLEEWLKQHEYQAMMLQSSKNAFMESINSMVDFMNLQMGALINSAKVTSAALNQIWISWKNSMLRILSELTIKMLFIAGLRLLIEGTGTWGVGWFNFLRGGLAALGQGVQDAIVQDGVITPFRKDDVVAIGTNMYGSRSGYNTGSIESKLDKIFNAIMAGNILVAKQKLIVNVDPISPTDISRLNRQGEKIERRS